MKWTISKTTLSGLVSCAIGIVVALSSLPPGAKWTVIALAVLKAVVGYLQTDADRTQALVPGSTVPEMVAAHPVPDDPADKVVQQ